MNFLVEIADNHGGRDNLVARSYVNLPVDGVEVASITWQLDDSTQSLVSSTALPADAPDLSLAQQPFGLSIVGASSS